jgi:hypothetical protein
MRMRAAIALLALAMTACIDFIAPDIPELGAPAVVEATIRLTDVGTSDVDVRLVPGLDEDGFRRHVPRDTVDVLGFPIGPDSVLRNGTRRYLGTWEFDRDGVARPATFRAPEVEGVVAPVPAIDWAGLRRLDADTLDVRRGEDLVLRIETYSEPLEPRPDIRQWFLRLEGDSTAFGVNADGPPPDTLVIPARWIPGGDELRVRLIFSQSVLLNPPPGDYLGLVTLDSRLHWTIRIRDAAIATSSARLAYPPGQR